MPIQPNVLFILSDQHDPAVAGYAGDLVVHTPHLDALARRSVQFESAVCTSPLCTPSRMCLLTGKDVHRCAGWNNHWVIFPEHLTWPAHFAAQGYRTCLVGKMHFGGRDQMQGFQDRPYGDLRHGLGHQPDPLAMFPGYAAVRSAGATEVPESLLQDVVVTRESLAFIKEQAAGDDGRPWFVCASYSRPHPPFTAPGRYLRRYRDRVPPPASRAIPDEVFARRRTQGHADLTEEEVRLGREGYYACVEFLDDCIGELLDGLDRAGLLENTVVIYTSDHGEMLGQHGIWGKSVYYDPAVRVPLLISGPGVAAGGHRVRHPVSLLDLYPTTCGLAGLPIPAGLDGKDLSALLAEPATAPAPHEVVHSSFYQYGQTISYPAPVDDAEPHRAWRMVRSADWKLVEVEGGATLLFDLQADPREEVNLADDPAHAERLATMRRLLFARFSWAEVHERLQADRVRLPAFKSGRAPTTPNQYRLPDGREFDAESALYGARWLPIQPGSNGGIIPQQFG
jgi:choline-sulfatase